MNLFLLLDFCKFSIFDQQKSDSEFQVTSVQSYMLMRRCQYNLNKPLLNVCLLMLGLGSKENG